MQHVDNTLQQQAPTPEAPYLLDRFSRLTLTPPCQRKKKGEREAERDRPAEENHQEALMGHHRRDATYPCPSYGAAPYLDPFQGAGPFLEGLM